MGQTSSDGSSGPGTIGGSYKGITRISALLICVELFDSVWECYTEVGCISMYVSPTNVLMGGILSMKDFTVLHITFDHFSKIILKITVLH